MKIPSSQTRWLTTWVCITCVPFLPLYRLLIENLLSDTPDAYLCFVPVMAVIWVVRELRNTQKDYQDDKELNVILGISLSFVVLFVAIWGFTHYPLTFYGEGLSMALWPFWGLAVTWFIFGVGASRQVWKPLLFLCLVNPSLYDFVSSTISTTLSHVTNTILMYLAHTVHWIRWQGGNGSVLHHGQWISVTITTACTGADSLMAVLIVFIFLLSSRVGSMWVKLLWVLSGVLFAIFVNFIRVFALMWVLNHWGSSQLFDDTHATLGLVLFILMAAVLIKVGDLMGLKQRRVMTVSSHMKVPGRVSFVATVLSSLLLLGIVSFGRYDNQANVSTAFPVRSDIANGVYPGVSGYYMISLGQFNDASVLGAGTLSYAMAYSNNAGQYYRVESWNTPSGWRLEAFDVNNCLSFHGDKILNQESIILRGTIHAQVYLIALQPLKRGAGEDVYGVVTVTFQDKDRTINGNGTYERIEISSPLRRNVPTQQLQSKSVNSSLLVNFSSAFLNNLLVSSGS